MWTPRTPHHLTQLVLLNLGETLLTAAPSPAGFSRAASLLASVAEGTGHLKTSKGGLPGWGPREGRGLRIDPVNRGTPVPEPRACCGGGASVMWCRDPSMPDWGQQGGSRRVEGVTGVPVGLFPGRVLTLLERTDAMGGSAALGRTPSPAIRRPLSSLCFLSWGL